MKISLTTTHNYLTDEQALPAVPETVMPVPAMSAQAVSAAQRITVVVK